MTIPRKLYSVTFGEMDKKTDIPSSLSYTVMASTAEEAFGIVRTQFFSKKEEKTYYAAEAKLIAPNIDVD